MRMHDPYNNVLVACPILVSITPEYQQCTSTDGALTRNWVLTDVADSSKLATGKGSITNFVIFYYVQSYQQGLVVSVACPYIFLDAFSSFHFIAHMWKITTRMVFSHEIFQCKICIGFQSLSIEYLWIDRQTEIKLRRMSLVERNVNLLFYSFILKNLLIIPQNPPIILAKIQQK